MNHEINAPEVRLIDENGQMLGVMSPREAMGIAEGRGLDLIEISPTAKPPTCKIMDYGKYKYEAKKKEKEAQKKKKQAAEKKKKAADKKIEEAEKTKAAAEKKKKNN